MTKAVLTLSPSSVYDDLPEQRYHFPKTYLRQMEAAIGDWVIYYEPRRTGGGTNSGGRQAYFAIAMVKQVRPDLFNDGYYYADVHNYLPLYSSVPFREGDFYYESMLKRADGKTSKGAFGRAVRSIPDDEYVRIIQLGFSRSLADWEVADNGYMIREERPLIEQIIQRPFRDQAFRQHVRHAYDNTCAITGLKLINGGGRPEVQAAHIVPVEKSGPDSVRNGLALTGTVHWLFDRGLITVDDSFHLVVARKGLPDGTHGLVEHGRKLRLPEDLNSRPHSSFLRWHRENVFHSELY